MSLWGDEFVIAKPEPKKVIKKVNNPQEPRVAKTSSKKLVNTMPVNDLLDYISINVEKTLGKYKENTITITNMEELHEYISKAISNGEIAIDTETDNSLDPITCRLMGPCIYTPGMKQAYIPINHVDLQTRKRLDNQLTEQDVYEEFSRLGDTKVITHNGKFDYQVLKCTCGWSMEIYWDTMIGVRILDENEKLAGLKFQYMDKIDSSDEKYSIEELFEGVEYAIVPPELFALYASTDAYKTYKLYKWQEEQFNRPGNEKLKNLFLNIEMPIVEISAEMELTGVEIDIDYAHSLSEKYHKLVNDVDDRISKQLDEYKDIIAKWRLTPEANYKPSKINKKTGEEGFVKSKSEQLKDPPELTSPLQFAILLYDVLGIPTIDKKTPRGTGEDILTKIDNPLCKLVLQKRGLEKLIGTYIDKIPEGVNKADNRLHAHFNQLGTDTGRFSSSDPTKYLMDWGHKIRLIQGKAVA